MIKITAAVSAISFSLAITSATGSSNNVDFLHGNGPKDVASKSPHVSSAGRCPPVDVEKLEAQELLHSQDGAYNSAIASGWRMLSAIVSFRCLMRLLLKHDVLCAQWCTHFIMLQYICLI